MTGLAVRMGATLACTFGAAPSTLVVLPTRRVLTGQLPVATVADHVPLLNVPPFGMCSSLANPVVAAATAAALGVLTPMPCVPVLPTPWVPGAPRTLVGGVPALDVTCKNICAWGGSLTIVNAGQATVTVA